MVSKDFHCCENLIQGCLLQSALGVPDRLVLSNQAWERMTPLIIGPPDQKGVWWRIFETRADDPDFAYLIVASTVVRGLGCPVRFALTAGHRGDAPQAAPWSEGLPAKVVMPTSLRCRSLPSGHRRKGRCRRDPGQPLAHPQLPRHRDSRRNAIAAGRVLMRLYLWRRTPAVQGTS